MATGVVESQIVPGDDGVARIDGSRYKVAHIADEHYHYGWTAEELLRQHPDLRPEQVYAALAYFYDHHAAFVAEIAEGGDQIEDTRKSQTLSRSELLARRAGSS